MSDSVKTRIAEDLRKAKTEGELRTERIREIVKAAVSSAVIELKEGSVELRSLVKDAVSVVIDTLQDRGQEAKDEISASIEGAIEGISSQRRQAIIKAQTEVQQLQSKIDYQEQELQEDIDSALTDVELTGENASSTIKTAIASSIAALKDTEEVALMQKRYAQLQAQIAILKANLTARYGERYDETKRYLDDAKTWYQEAQNRASQQAEAGEEDWVKQKQAKFENKMTEAGTALARKEQQVRQILKELWHSVTDLTTSDK